jgi:hypothetical protein
MAIGALARAESGLPDFQIKNTSLGKFLEGLALEDVGIFYDHGADR